MSFQDVKPSSAPRKPGEKRGLLQSYQGPPSTILEEQQAESVTGMGYSALSDDILAYRRHVDMLQKLAAMAGTPQETAATQTQLRLQTDVVSELGQKIETKLLASERTLASNGGGGGSGPTAAQARATHAKLTRDYRRVETIFKNIQMDIKRRKGLAEARRKEALEEEERKKYSGDAQEEARRMQLQMQEDKLAEEIIREREEEIRNINKGMHTVNEIYKDLAHIVGDQQDDIDAVENHMEDANKNAQAGLNQVQKANEKADNACIIC